MLIISESQKVWSFGTSRTIFLYLVVLKFHVMVTFSVTGITKNYFCTGLNFLTLCLDVGSYILISFLTAAPCDVGTVQRRRAFRFTCLLFLIWRTNT